MQVSRQSLPSHNLALACTQSISECSSQSTQKNSDENNGQLYSCANKHGIKTERMTKFKYPTEIFQI